MPWEKRGHRLYYYRKRREGKRVISEYVGRGELAEAMAVLDALEREECQAEQDRDRTKLEEQLVIDREIDGVSDLVGIVTRAVLLASGYHTHKGQWRRKRDDRFRRS